MAMALAMVLWVLCMNRLGLSIVSPPWHMSERKRSLVSSMPHRVAAITASGASIPAFLSACSDDSVAAFRSLPMRRVSRTGMYCLSSARLSELSITTSAATTALWEYEGHGYFGSSRLSNSDESLPPNPNELQITRLKLTPSMPIEGSIQAMSAVL